MRKLFTLLCTALLSVCALTFTSCDDDNGDLKLYQELLTFTDGPVDLGLSVMWSSCNLGADVPSGYGDYYAWGETSTKTDYTKGKWSNVTFSKLKSQDVVDDNGNLKADHDVASVLLGSNWRMPTSAEFEELINNCTWRWFILNGVYGYAVTGPSGKSIFLPTAGYRYSTSASAPQLLRGYYWASTAKSDNNNAGRLILQAGRYEICHNLRCDGLSVRPVYVTSAQSDVLGE